MISQVVQIFRRHSQALQPVETGVIPSIEKLSGIKSVLFDVYGTLLISGSGDVGTTDTSDKNDAVRRMLQSRQCDPSLAEQVIEAFDATIDASHRRSRADGIDFPEIDVRTVWLDVGKATGLLPYGDSRDQTWIECWASEFEARVNPVWPMPNLSETLASVADRCAMGIISNAQFFTPLLFPALLNQSLDNLGFATDLRWFSYQTGIAKPSCQMFGFAAECLKQRGISAHEVLYVGNDVRNDMAPAAKTGFRTALFAGDRRSLRLRESIPELAQFKPDSVLTDLSQLLLCIA